MTRLTKSEIEQRLLSGEKIEWKEATGKMASVALDSAKQRRLLKFLLTSRVREVKGIPDDFVKGLADAYLAAGDPASGALATAASAIAHGPWKIHSIRIEGFGGVNNWKGSPFEL